MVCINILIGFLCPRIRKTAAQHKNQQTDFLNSVGKVNAVPLWIALSSFISVSETVRTILRPGNASSEQLPKITFAPKYSLDSGKLQIKSFG